MLEDDGICWSIIDIRLAVAEGPEGKKRRDRLFTKLDPNGNGSLSLTEVQAGLNGLLQSDKGRKKDEVAPGLIPGMTDFRQAIKAAFCNARNLGHSDVSDSATVDRTEFHALLVFFRHYLELLVLFRKLDDSDDMLLSEEELMPALPRLQKWGVTEEQLQQKLRNEPGHQVAFSHFAEWALRSTLESLVFDAHEGEELLHHSSPSAASPVGKGKINWAAVDERIPTASTPEASAERDALFKKMDITSQAALSLTAVQASISFILEGDHAQRKKGEVAQTLIPGIRDTRPAVKSAFAAARDIAPPPDKRGKRKQWQRENDTVDRREFHALLVYLRYYLELQVLFQELDTSEDLRISKDECDAAMPLLLGWGIDKAAVKKKFAEAKGDGQLKFASFADWCLRIRLDGHLFDNLEGDAPEAEVEEVSTEATNKNEIPEAPAQAKTNNEILENQEEQAMKSVTQVSSNEVPEVEQAFTRPVEESDTPKEFASTLPNAASSLPSAGDYLNNSASSLPNAWDLPAASSSGRAIDRSWKPPLSKSYSSLPFESTGVLKRAPHLKNLSHVRSLPKWRFGEKRPCAIFTKNDNPAPGTYALPQPEKTGKFRDQASHSFGGNASRFDRGDPPGKVQPAPGQYGIPKNPVHDMLRKPGFGNAARGNPCVIRAEGPGPGSYELRSRLSGAAVSVKGKMVPVYKPTSGLPGPGAYQPRLGCLTHERTAPKVSIGASTRENYSDSHVQHSPGPGAYDQETFKHPGRKSTSGFSMRSRVSCARNYTSYLTPGPGSYDGDGTCFGY